MVYYSDFLDRSSPTLYIISVVSLIDRPFADGLCISRGNARGRINSSSACLMNFSLGSFLLMFVLKTYFVRL